MVSIHAKQVPQLLEFEPNIFCKIVGHDNLDYVTYLWVATFACPEWSVVRVAVRWDLLAMFRTPYAWGAALVDWAQRLETGQGGGGLVKHRVVSKFLWAHRLYQTRALWSVERNCNQAKIFVIANTSLIYTVEQRNQDR